jgi:SAM-dependent methyltransferase
VSPPNDVATAYTEGAGAWADGPSRVYGRLATRLVDFSPESLAGRSVLDLGSGTGLGSRAALAAGARVIAIDVAAGMLLVDRPSRPPAAAGDARSLPFCDRAFDVVLAAFSLNHLGTPERGVRESARVASMLLASAYADDDDHPVKSAVESALRELGWRPPDWYTTVRAAMHSWSTVGAATATLEAGGMRPLLVEKLAIDFGDLTVRDLVEWRIGMAHTAPFVRRLTDDDRQRTIDRALEVLGAEPEPLVRRVIFMAAVSGRVR